MLSRGANLKTTVRRSPDRSGSPLSERAATPHAASHSQQSHVAAFDNLRRLVPSAAAAAAAAASVSIWLVAAPVNASELQSPPDLQQSQLPVAASMSQSTLINCSILETSWYESRITAHRVGHLRLFDPTPRSVALASLDGPGAAAIIADLNPLTWFQEKAPPPTPSPFDILPRIGGPMEVIGYLLQHPVAALVAGGGAAFLIPRLVRFGFRFVVIPGALILVAWLAINNPSSAWTAASGLFSAVVTHPVATSTVILLGSSFFLSPYILVAVLAVLLTTGTSFLPNIIRPALPGPVNEALKQVDAASGQLQSVFQQLSESVKTAPLLQDDS